MQTIYLDISNKGVIPCIMAKQSEVGRKFLAVITDNGVPYNIPDNSLLSVWYEGDTDAGNYSSIEEKSAFSIDGNKVTVELVAQMLLKPSKGELCLSITHGDGGETNTWNIPYEVEYKPGAGSAVPTEYYTALTEAAGLAAEQVGLATEQAQKAKEEAEKAKEYAEQTSDKLPTAGGLMFGPINMGGNNIVDLPEPTNENDAVNKGYVDARSIDYFLETGKDDVWVWRVWNSGFILLLGLADVIVPEKITETGPVFFTDVISIPYPEGKRFLSSPMRFLTTASALLLGASVYGTSVENFDFRLQIASQNDVGKSFSVFLMAFGQLEKEVVSE